MEFRTSGIWCDRNHCSFELGSYSSNLDRCHFSLKDGDLNLELRVQISTVEVAIPIVVVLKLRWRSEFESCYSDLQNCRSRLRKLMNLLEATACAFLNKVVLLTLLPLSLTEERSSTLIWWSMQFRLIFVENCLLMENLSFVIHY